jgi:hypothetical protein
MASKRDEYFGAIRQRPPMPDCVFEKKNIVKKVTLAFDLDSDGVVVEDDDIMTDDST